MQIPFEAAACLQSGSGHGQNTKNALKGAGGVRLLII